MKYSSFGTQNERINLSSMVDKTQCGLFKHKLNETYDYAITSIIPVMGNDSDDNGRGKGLDKSIAR